MANETILIIEPNPIELKMTAAALRVEGWRVQVASSGEQAISMLRTLRPDLVLVSLKLPGMTGLEVAAEVKQGSHTGGIAVIAISVSIADEEAALEAGCDGFIAKPIDIREVGGRVHACLHPAAVTDRPAVEEPESEHPLPADVLADPELRGWRRNFLAEGLRQSRALGSALECGQFDPAKALQLTQQWAAVAATVGYAKIARLARETVLLLQAPTYANSRMREAVARLNRAFGNQAESAEIPLPEPIAQALRGKRVALIGFANREAERICAALERVQALPRLLESAEPPDSEIVASCSLILVHIRSGAANGPDFASHVSLVPGQAMVLVGTREDLLAMDHAVQSRAREFLIDGWQPEEVILRLSLALTREPPQQYDEPAPRPRAAWESAEVLVVDDDLDIRSLVHQALTRNGMSCRIAANGTEALEMLERNQPRAIILDVNMPVMDGFEVLARIREQGLTVPVLMLTARQQEKDILLGFDLGADDYVVKPFSPAELVARLKRLVRE